MSNSNESLNSPELRETWDQLSKEVNRSILLASKYDLADSHMSSIVKKSGTFIRDSDSLENISDSESLKCMDIFPLTDNDKLGFRIVAPYLQSFDKDIFESKDNEIHDKENIEFMSMITKLIIFSGDNFHPEWAKNAKSNALNNSDLKKPLKLLIQNQSFNVSQIEIQRHDDIYDSRNIESLKNIKNNRTTNKLYEDLPNGGILFKINIDLERNEYVELRIPSGLGSKNKPQVDWHKDRDEFSSTYFGLKELWENSPLEFVKFLVSLTNRSNYLLER